MGIKYVWLFKAVAGQKGTCWWFIMGIRYVGLCQAVAAANQDLMVVYNGYQVCGAKMELPVVCHGYQVCGVIPSCSTGNDGSTDGTPDIHLICIRCVWLFKAVAGQSRTCW